MKESRQKAPSHVSDSIWLIAVPKAEFSEPPFHFGERVKWWIDDKEVRHYLTGRIWGCWYSESDLWEYYIKLDAHQNIGIELEDFVFLNQTELRKVSDSSSIMNQLKPKRTQEPAPLNRRVPYSASQYVPAGKTGTALQG